MKGANSTNLDAVFSALADPTRRAILAQLADGATSVGELTKPHQMSQPAISKHLSVLERAGLIRREAKRQLRLAHLEAGPMKDAVRWLEEFRQFWSGSFDQLDNLLNELKETERKGTSDG